MKDVGQPVRVALTGRTASPGLFQVLFVLGRDVSLARLDARRGDAPRAAESLTLRAAPPPAVHGPPAHRESSAGFTAFVETLKPVLPIPLLLIIIPLVWLFFRGTWREIDEEALRAARGDPRQGQDRPAPDGRARHVRA